MGSFNRDDRSGGGFSRGGSRGGDRGGRSSFGGGRSFGGGGDRGNRPLFSAICSNCGKDAQVPFRPTNGKPVYCSDCFEKMGNRSDSRSPERSGFRPQTPSVDQNKAVFDSLNNKLDKIIRLLEPKVTENVSVSPIMVDQEQTSEIKLEKAPKAKKVLKKVSSKK